LAKIPKGKLGVLFSHFCIIFEDMITS